MEFCEKTVVITGAAVGIGYATAVKFAMNGANLILFDRNAEKLNELKNKLPDTVGRVKYIVGELRKANIGKGWRVYISHADAMDKAQMTMNALKEAMPEAYYEILPLSPAFITQGGPGCVAVQYVKE